MSFWYLSKIWSFLIAHGFQSDLQHTPVDVAHPITRELATKTLLRLAFAFSYASLYRL